MKLQLTLILLAFQFFATAQTLKFYIPPNVKYVRGMIVGGNVSNSAQWRNLADKLSFGCSEDLSELTSVATASAHPEIKTANVILTGNSAGALQKLQEAVKNPSRVIAIHASHGGFLAEGNDGFNINRGSTSPTKNTTVPIDSISKIPILFTFDNKDGFVSPVIIQGFTIYGRGFNAPWTFVIDSTDNHTDYSKSFPITIAPWLESVVKQRIPTQIDTTKLSFPLKSLTDSKGWLGNLYSKKIAPFAKYGIEKDSANWFPDSLSAYKWSKFAMIPTYRIPPQPIVPLSGIIADLKVFDPVLNDITSGTMWRVNSNFKECDQLLNVIRYFSVSPIPNIIKGTNWIRSVGPGSSTGDFTVDPIFSFRVTADATVYVALTDAVKPLPSWLSDWTDTKEDLLVCTGDLKNFQKYSIYSKFFAKNSISTMGNHGTIPSAMYMTFVKPDKTTQSTQLVDNEQIIDIFPNPTNHEINISLSTKEDYLIQIFNPLGEILFTSKNKNVIDLSNFAEGLYVVKITIKNQTFIKKIIKN
jgi:Secretion system C-terminal sorting domain